MSDDKDAIKASLVPLIAEARATKKWLWCNYQDMWFSPSELEKANAEGRFLWGPINWRLRDPQERVLELERAVSGAQAQLERFKKALAEA